MQDDETALMRAANGGHLQVVQELLKHGASMEAQNVVMRGCGILTPLKLTPTLH